MCSAVVVSGCGSVEEVRWGGGLYEVGSDRVVLIGGGKRGFTG